MEPEKKSHGALIGSIIVIVILVIGGIYVWQNKAKELQKENENAAKIQEEESNQELNGLDQELNSLDTNIDADAANSLE